MKIYLVWTAETFSQRNVLMGAFTSKNAAIKYARTLEDMCSGGFKYSPLIDEIIVKGKQSVLRRV
jgi:hypothetical protein